MLLLVNRYSFGTSFRSSPGSTTSPPRNTFAIVRVLVIRSRGSASSRMRSASLPGSMVPSRSACPRASALLSVAQRSASAGDRPDSTSSLQLLVHREARRDERLGRVGPGEQRHSRPVELPGQLLVLPELAATGRERLGAEVRAALATSSGGAAAPASRRCRGAPSTSGRSFSRIPLRKTTSVGSTKVRLPDELGDQLLRFGVVEVQGRAMVGPPGFLGRDDVVEDRPDVLQRVDAVRHRVLRRVGPEVARDPQPRLWPSAMTARPISRGADVDLEGGDPPAHHLVHERRDLRRIGQREADVPMVRRVPVDQRAAPEDAGDFSGNASANRATSVSATISSPMSRTDVTPAARNSGRTSSPVTLAKSSTCTRCTWASISPGSGTSRQPRSSWRQGASRRGPHACRSPGSSRRRARPSARASITPRRHRASRSPRIDDRTGTFGGLGTGNPSECRRQERDEEPGGVAAHGLSGDSWKALAGAVSEGLKVAYSFGTNFRIWPDRWRSLRGRPSRSLVCSRSVRAGWRRAG